jgi:hypothetical protein
MEEAEIKRATIVVRDSKYADIIKGGNGGAQANIFKKYFRIEYKGKMDVEDAAVIAWKYYTKAF